MAELADPLVPFRIETPDAALVDLRDRLRRTRWTDDIAGAGWDYGTERAYLQELCAYWAEEFDWRAAEARLNSWPQVRTVIDGTYVHAIHARSPHPGAVPLLLTHGWPGSLVEFLAVIGPLTDPPAYGGNAADAFHVVCPSLPGYGWSGPTSERGWHIARVADALAELMTRLGYDTYIAQGGDWGALATVQLAARHPDRLRGLHLNMPVAARPPEGEREPLTEAEQARLARTREYAASGSGYNAIQSTRPQSLAYGLADSPAGLAGWIVEKFRAWSDCHGEVESAFSRDDLLTNISAYWFTGTIGSSTRLYYETAAAGLMGAMPPRIDVPAGMAAFPMDIIAAPRHWVERQYDLVHWTEMPRGGHFAAMEQPALLVDDVRAFRRVLTAT